MKIYWDKTRFPELAYLFYSLKSLDIIGVMGNRGYFSALEKHIVDFDDILIANGYLKMLSHKIANNQKKYLSLKTTIDSIIQEVIKIAEN